MWSFSIWPRHMSPRPHILHFYFSGLTWEKSHLGSDRFLLVSLSQDVWKSPPSKWLLSWDSLRHSPTWMSLSSERPGLCGFLSRVTAHPPLVYSNTWLTREGDLLQSASLAGQEKLGQQWIRVKRPFGRAAVWLRFLLHGYVKGSRVWAWGDGAIN